MPVNYPTYFQPVNQIPDPMAFSKETHDILNNAVPGLDNLTRSASGDVGSLLNGLPSPSVARRANAYFGTRSGVPSSDFVRNRGFDLYGQQADQYRQRGFDDFLNLLKGASGTIAPTPGEQSQNTQFNQNLQQRGIEANQQTQRFNVQNPMAPNGVPNNDFANPTSSWTDTMGSRHWGRVPNII